MPTLSLVNPAADFPTYFGGEVFAARGFAPGVLAADLAIPTVAALVPRDFDVSLCDENIAPIDYDALGEFVGITGKITQLGRMAEIAAACRRRGRTVLIGGPCASLSPDRLRPHADILVRGELESIAAELFADLRARRWRDEYFGDKPDLAFSPLPRWELYPVRRALAGTVQTSRGCPFACEFCDVIQYLGRKQRHKPVAQVLAELDRLYALGFRAVLLADDNFTVYRARTRELLTALRDWNRRLPDGPMLFATQVSLDAADDEALLVQCAEAGIAYVFIGIETSDEAALREARKPQNLGGALVERVRRFLDVGIGVTGGMIVGFDADGPDAFERQYDFAMSSPVPIWSVGVLVAPEATPLHARMALSGRLVDDGCEAPATPWDTNIVPARMNRAELTAGVRGLVDALYRPAAFGDRMLAMLRCLGSRRQAERGRLLASGRAIERNVFELVARLGVSGIGPAAMLARVVPRILAKPEATALAGMALLQYQQIRWMIECGYAGRKIGSDASGPKRRPIAVKVESPRSTPQTARQAGGQRFGTE